MDGLPVARLLGFEVRVHWSWILVLAIVAALAVAEVDALMPQLAQALQWLIGILVALGFLASAAAHDLAHAAVARSRGLVVDTVTVSFFGGSSIFEPTAGQAGDEVAIALAGPIVSILVGLMLTGASLAASAVNIEILQAAWSFGAMLGLLNLVLGAANLVPAYPLDGGRLLRAVVWARTGDLRRGTRIAARSGSLIGLLVIGLGLWVMLYTDSTNGLMILVAGWFFRQTARSGLQRVELETLMDGLRAGDVMEPVLGTISPGLTVDTFAQQILGGEPSRTAVLVARGDEVVGMVGATQLRRLRRARWPATHVSEIMVPRAQLPDLALDAPVWPAFLQLRQAGLDGLPVAGPDGPAGILTVRSVVLAIQARRPNARRGTGLLP